MSEPRRHHQVSRFLVDYWARPVPGRRTPAVALVDKQGRTSRTASPADVFNQRDQFAFEDDTGRRLDLEHAWSDIENSCAPFVGRFNRGEPITPSAAAAMKSLMALHLVRSPHLVTFTSEVLPGLAEEILSEKPQIEADANSLARYLDQYAVTSLADSYNRAFDYLERFHVGRARIRQITPTRFVLPDHGVIVADRKSGRVSQVGDLLPMGEADLIALPTSPTTAMLLHASPNPREEFISPELAMDVNRYAWRSAHRFIVIHRQSAIQSCFGVSLDRVR